MHVIELKNYEAVSEKVAEMVNNQIIANPHSLLGLCTGKSPQKLYDLLIETYDKGRTDWSRMTTFLVDEFLGVPEYHIKSYQNAIVKRLLNKLNIHPENAFNLTNKAAVPSFEDYDKIIQNKGGLDILLLGIGVNAHIGFCEPGTNEKAETHVVDFTPSQLTAYTPFFKENEWTKQGVTMGIASILKAKRIIVIASGQSKAQAIKDMVEGPITNRVPASFLQKHRNVWVIADKEATSLLSSKSVTENGK